MINIIPVNSDKKALFNALEKSVHVFGVLDVPHLLVGLIESTGIDKETGEECSVFHIITPTVVIYTNAVSLIRSLRSVVSLFESEIKSTGVLISITLGESANKKKVYRVNLPS